MSKPELTNENLRFYEFGPFRMDPVKRLLYREGEVVTLTPKLFETLRVLVERGGEQISKDDLMQAVWGDTIVEETNLTTNVSNLRKLLGEKKNEHQYILTIPGSGYRFVAPVKVTAADSVEVVVRESVRTKLTVEEQTYEQTPAVKKSQVVVIGVLVTILVLVGVYFFLGRRTPPATSGSGSIKSLAILPFKPLAAADKDESLELGITEALITKLSQVLVVRQLSAVRAYAGLEQDAITAGRQQRVDAVLDGSIQRAGNRVRVTARLINVQTGQQIWAAQFDKEYAYILDVQEQIARQLAESVVNLTVRQKELIAKRYTHSVEANRLYEQGRSLWHKRGLGDLVKAIEYFNQAIEKDPNYALAYAGLADTYVVLPGHADYSTPETHPKAKANALKALELDSELQEPYVTLAAIAADYWQWEEADKQFKRALELNPNYATAHQWYGEYMTHVGRLDEGMSAIQRAWELDPRSRIINSLFAQSLYLLRRYDEAISQCQKTLELDPNFVPAHLTLGMSYMQKGLFDQSKAEFQKAFDLSGAPRYLALLATAHSKSGNTQEAGNILESFKRMQHEKQLTAGDMSTIYTGIGNRGLALEWLEKAYEERSWVLLYLADPFYDGLRFEKRFKDIQQRVLENH